jgi:hypothetical protein
MNGTIVGETCETSDRFDTPDPLEAFYINLYKANFRAHTFWDCEKCNERDSVAMSSSDVVVDVPQ